MDARKLAGELVVIARDLVAGDEVGEAIRHVDAAGKILRGLAGKMSSGEEKLDMAKEIRFVERAEEQLTILSINLEGLKRRVR